MFENAHEIIRKVAAQTDSVILMHSLTGKDSIALLDLIAPYFKRIVCVFMYIIPDLEHNQPYLTYAARKYPNTEWIQVPHYGLYSYIKTGYMGCAQNPAQRLWKLSDIIDKVREKTGIEWCCCGFKQADSLNRRLMLRSYKGPDALEGISWAGKKFYPLSTYYNRDILAYIEANHLKAPESYGIGKSQGESITDYGFLKYLQTRYPRDLERVYKTFPATRTIIPVEEDKRRRKEAEKEAARLARKADKAATDTGDNPTIL